MLEGVVILLLILCLLVFLWWQCLWPRASQASHLYGRICLLASWAGLGPDPWQTPSEYIQRLILIVPEVAGLLERLCDLAVREQWADPTSAEHPHHSGELQELPDLWKQLGPHLFWAVLRYCVELPRWQDGRTASKNGQWWDGIAILSRKSQKKHVKR
jgi:hypothetical protein